MLVALLILPFLLANITDIAEEEGLDDMAVFTDDTTSQMSDPQSTDDDDSDAEEGQHGRSESGVIESRWSLPTTSTS